jgi:hypothetical protein
VGSAVGLLLAEKQPILRARDVDEIVAGYFVATQKVIQRTGVRCPV